MWNRANCPSRRRRTIWAVALGLVFAMHQPWPAFAARGNFRGQSLEACLNILRQQGLNIVYSSTTVTGDMIVLREPVASEPRTVLDELLSPHGLRVEEGSHNTLIVVRDHLSAERRGRIVGVLRRMPIGAPGVGLVVSIEPSGRRTLTDEHGRFEFRAVPVGRYALQLSHPELTLRTGPVADVRPGEIARLHVEAFEISAPDLAEVIVTASRYSIGRSLSPSSVAVAGVDLQRLPNFGDDPMRALARLPGLRGSDFSAQLNARGGDTDEMLIRFDGLTLQNPFHLKDFLSPFSVLNLSVIGNVDVHTGGFPVEFGDRLSGVIDIDAAAVPDGGIRELSLSLFNASMLVAGPFARKSTESPQSRPRSWVVAARRSNLDLVTQALDSRLGRPAYQDLYARLQQGAGIFDLTLSALVVDDDIQLSDGDAEERASARSRDTYMWARARMTPTESIVGDTVLSFSHLRSERRGSADQPGVGRGSVDDLRRSHVATLRTDWSWKLEGDSLWRWGAEWALARAKYDYRNEMEFDVLVNAPGIVPDSARARRTTLAPRLDYLGAYASLRLSGPGTSLVEGGMRFDHESASRGGSQRLSPRIAMLYPIGDQLQLRGSWSRFVQSQGIDQLSVADGVTEFAAPQRAEHRIVSIEYRHPTGLDLRLEAYEKRYRSLRPRFENLLNNFVLLPELKPDRIAIAPDGAVARGIEMSVRRREGRPIDWWLTYGRSSVRDDFGAGLSVPRRWDLRHQLSAGLAWEGSRWDVSVVGAYHSGFPTTEFQLRSGQADDETPIIEIGPINALRLKNYRSIDVHVARKVRFAPDNQLTVFLDVTNVLGARNQCCVEYQIDDEAAAPTLDLNRLAARPLVPSLGVTWRF